MVMISTGLGGRAGVLAIIRRTIDASVREARANPKILIGLAAIVLLMWSYGLIWLSDSVGAAGRRLADTEIEIRRTTALAGETSWDARAAEVEALRTKLLGRLWGGETEGQAQADFQEAISKAARESGLGRPQVRVDRDPTQTAGLGVRVLGASIGADFAPAPLSAFLLKLGELDRTIQVRSLRTTRQPIARLDILITAYNGPPTQGACVAPGAPRPASPAPVR